MVAEQAPLRSVRRSQAVASARRIGVTAPDRGVHIQDGGGVREEVSCARDGLFNDLLRRTR